MVFHTKCFFYIQFIGLHEIGVIDDGIRIAAALDIKEGFEALRGTWIVVLGLEVES